MIIAWAFGGLLLLSLSATKRDIYLFPLLPGFAILASLYIESSARWVRVLLLFICRVMLSLMVFFAFAKLALVEGKPTLQWGFSLPVLACAGAGILLMLRYKPNILVSVSGVSALFYLAVVFTTVPLIDRYKNYEPATRKIAAAIPGGERERVCGWDLDETTRAIFLYYADPPSSI